MAIEVFYAFIAAYALLAIAHRDRSARSYKLFGFGFLISVLYASVYSLFPDQYLLYIFILASLAILTQYFHVRAVETGRVRRMHMLVDVTSPPHWEKGMVGAERRRAARANASRRVARAALSRSSPLHTLAQRGPAALTRSDRAAVRRRASRRPRVAVRRQRPARAARRAERRTHRRRPDAMREASRNPRGRSADLPVLAGLGPEAISRRERRELLRRIEREER